MFNAGLLLQTISTIDSAHLQDVANAYLTINLAATPILQGKT